MNVPNKKVQDQWIILLKEIIQIINYDSIEKECEQNVLLLTEKSQPQSNKITAARIMGILAQVNLAIYKFFKN